MKYVALLALFSVFLVSASASPVDTQRVVVFEADLSANNFVELVNADDEKDENKSVLEQLREKLMKYVEKLRKEGKGTRAKIVQYYIKVLDQIVEKMDKNEIELPQVREFIKRVKKYLEKYADETPEDLVFAIFEDEEPKDPEDIDDGDDDVEDPDTKIPDDEKEEKKSRLEELREQLRKLRERLVKRGKTIRARIVGHYLRLLDRILDRMEKNKISAPRVEAFIERCKKFLERFMDDEDEDNQVAQLVSEDDDDEDEKKENRTILERLRERLVKLLERLRKDRKSIRARIVEHYLKVLDRILDRMDRNDIDLPRVREFIKRVKKFLGERLED